MHFNSHANYPLMKHHSQLLTFAHAARECAMQMMHNAAYIQRELPTIEAPPEIRTKIEAVCESFIGTKHDVITELFELDEQSQAGASLENLSEKMNRVERWLSEPIQEMHELITQLQVMVQTDSRYALMFFLLVESATNILNAFNAVRMAADAAQN